MGLIKTFFRITTPMWVVFLLNEFLFIFFKDFFILNFPWVDWPMHVIGGMVASWTAYLFLKLIKAEFKPGWLIFLVLIGFTCLSAILWEVYEYYHDLIYREIAYQISSLDTVADLGNGLTGSFLFCLGLWWKKK